MDCQCWPHKDKILKMNLRFDKNSFNMNLKLGVAQKKKKERNRWDGFTLTSYVKWFHSAQTN